MCFTYASAGLETEHELSQEVKRHRDSIACCCVSLSTKQGFYVSFTDKCLAPYQQRLSESLSKKKSQMVATQLTPTSIVSCSQTSSKPSNNHHLLVTLTILLYWSMIESGLALIAACLPTLQFLVLLSAIKSGVYTARRLLTTTQPSLKSTPSQPYFKSQTPEHSQRSLNYESYELSKNTGKVSDVGSGRDLLRV
jgi:hypothetical protein